MQRRQHGFDATSGSHAEPDRERIATCDRDANGGRVCFAGRTDRVAESDGNTHAHGDDDIAKPDGEPDCCAQCDAFADADAEPKSDADADTDSDADTDADADWKRTV